MRSSFGGRRQARKVGHDEDEEDSGDGRTGFGSQNQGMIQVPISAVQDSDMCT